jgi:hypothetical protein
VSNRALLRYTPTAAHNTTKLFKPEYANKYFRMQEDVLRKAKEGNTGQINPIKKPAETAGS